MPDLTEGDADVKRVRQHVNSLAEHFDSVQIFCTRHDGSKDGTVNIHVGAGNWFTRYGFCHAWLIRQDEVERMNQRKDDDEPVP